MNDQDVLDLVIVHRKRERQSLTNGSKDLNAV